MPLDRRTDAAGLFWADDHSADQQLEAVASIASHMKFRARSVVTLPLDKKARYLAGLPTISDTVAARALVNYHLERQRPMMAAFLDLLAIPHDNGLISDETVKKPDADVLDTSRRRARHEVSARRRVVVSGHADFAGSGDVGCLGGGQGVLSPWPSPWQPARDVGKCVALVVFLRGVNVGGHRRFRPSILARAMSNYGVVNVGAAGTFVVRKPGSRAKFRTALLRKLP